MALTSASSGQLNGARQSTMVRFWQSAALTGSRPRTLARLSSDSKENSRPERTAESSPWVASLPHSKLGVTSSRPRLTSPTMRISWARMRSRNSKPSSSRVKAGKLAKPRVAMATPATFTAWKKVIQWAPSSRPPSPSRASWRRSGLRVLPRVISWANSARATTANSPRPKVMIMGALSASLPKIPDSPNSRAPRWMASSALRSVMPGGPRWAAACRSRPGPPCFHRHGCR
ncbi:hypothetical protein D3C84_733590 [compost metagenome]